MERNLRRSKTDSSGDVSRTAPRTDRRLELGLKVGRKRLALAQLHEEDHALVSASLRLLADCQKVKQSWGLARPCEGVENIVNFRGAKSNAAGVSGNIGSADYWTAQYPPGRSPGGEGGLVGTYKTPSDRPSMTKPPPFPCLERVTMI